MNSNECFESQRDVLPWIETPIDERDGDPPHLYRHSDATPIELFFDLFFVANLSTFTATHEINNLEGAHIGRCYRLSGPGSNILASIGLLHQFSGSYMVHLASSNSIRYSICPRLGI